MLRGLVCTAFFIIIEGQFQMFQRFSGSKLSLKAVSSRFVALNYYEKGSTASEYMHQVDYVLPASRTVA